jgi:hypothetical protein
MTVTLASENPNRKMRRSQLVGLLAPTLGLEKTEEVVQAASRKLRIPLGDELTGAQAAAILDELTQWNGIVGVVARFVKTRGELEDLPPPSVPPSSQPSPPPQSPSPKDARVRREELVALLSPALGDAKSEEAISAYAPKVGSTGTDFTRAQAAKMLELMSASDGILGVVASFARARFLLKFPG